MRRFLLALLMALLALTAAAGTGDDSGEVPLTRLSLGDIGGWIELPVVVNGQAGRWLLDTGSTQHIVSAAFAQRHALHSRGRTQTHMALGSVPGTEVDLPALAIGTRTLAGQTALLLENLAAVLGPAGEGVDGVLGAPLLAGAVLDLDLQRWTLRIRPGPADAADCPAGFVSLPLHTHRGLPVIALQLDRAAAVKLLLDTGNPAAVVLIGADGGAGSGLPMGPDAWLAQVPAVTAGAWQRTRVPVLQLNAPTLQRALAPQVQGLAGTALIDGSHWQLRLDRGLACASADPPALPGGFGLTLAQRDGVLRIDQVLRGGPAEAAGLQAGELVSRWAGAAPDTPLRELWARVQQQERLELSVGPAARTVHLRRTHFLPLRP